MMPRLMITVTDEMESALKQVSDERGVPVAGLIRQAVAEFLLANGQPVDFKVSWGGKRKDKKTKKD